MSGIQQGLAVVGAIVMLAVVAGGLWAVFRSADRDARIDRLEGERDDYLSRLNFIEPRFKELEQQNKLLLDLHNPSDQIAALRVQEQTNHDRTVAILSEQSTTLHQIDTTLHGRGGQ